MIKSLPEAINYLPEAIKIDTEFLLDVLGWIGWLGLAGIIAAICSIILPKLISLLLPRFFSPQTQAAYRKVIEPYDNWLGIVVLLTVLDLIILITTTPSWLEFIEVPISLSLGIIISWLGSRLFRQFFDIYLLDAAFQKKRKVNSELLMLGKLLANSTIIFIVVFLFAQTHRIDIFGLLAGLGIGGLAVAFAAQKTLEQLLGGIVIYADCPFVVDDYIGLSDGTFGRVEAIGLRSTKIRTSGKGTLVVIPNSSLTEMNIENFTGAKKVISMIYLTFYRAVAGEEKALIRQVILESTRDVFGIDSRSTEVIFKDTTKNGNQAITKAQVNFFILGSGQVSMDLRRQLLDIANQNIAKQLKEYGIAFDIDEQMINVDSPITI